ncbi:TetR/AcrR family transcriptional regulator [Rhizobium sp. CNPSo 4039]|uniref:TetR/AcrR family transcriptional regulator n=1 Tax=Rhizobium sp. CNPSo 4039 TaxID=3021409 RepID=UPI0025501385|nr:TetR/AcrR family transcriptional regulator [Rhizobium sp. CNPSo 4039]MDK4717510.1 TetR/AcrR family transcriptional regulator [Rhizobium sp. CNPSo 4039]
MARQREFDIDEAVSKATTLFWEHGYDRTSLADLTRIIGCKPPSFYFAFGSKDGLFRIVLERYYKTYLGAAEEALKEQTSRRVVESMLTRLADIYTDPSHPVGCLAIKCTMSGSLTVEAVEQRQAELRASRRGRLIRRFEAAVATGDLPAGSDAEELARYVLVLGTGMALDAQAGATRAQLQQVINRALVAWPS